MFKPVTRALLLYQANPNCDCVICDALPHPQVAREGTKKTVFTNFMELCKSMNRNHEHVLVRGCYARL